MPPTLIESGSNPDYSAAVLTDPALAALHASGAPAFVTQSEPLQIKWANRSALALFESRGLADLSARLFGTPDPGSKRLCELAQNGLAGQPARMERLRFFLGRRAEVITFLCRRVTVKSGITLFAAAAVGVRPSAKTVFDADLLSRQSAIVGSEHFGDDAPDAAIGLDSLKAILAEKLNGAQRVRFVWHSDAEDRLTHLSPEFATIVGTSGESLIGQRLLDVAHDLQLDPSGGFTTAISRYETFKGIDLFWPIRGSNAVVPVTLGALPNYDADHLFTGFRGFGIVHVDQAQVREDSALSPSASSDELPADGESTKAQPSEEAPVNQPMPPAAEIEAADLARDHPNVVYLRPQFGHADKADAEEEVTAGATARGLISGQTFVAGRPIILPSDNVRLSSSERNAFREIARALSAHVEASIASPLSAEAADAGLRQEGPVEIGDGPLDLPTIVPSAIESLTDSTAPDSSSTRVREGTDGEDMTVAPSPAGFDLAIVKDAELAAMETAGAQAERNAEVLLNELPFGLAVVRASTPVFINRALLQIIGYSDRESLRNGLDHILTRIGSLKLEEETTLVVDTAEGEVSIECRAQPIDWSGSSATLVSLRRTRQSELGQRVRTLELDVRLKETESRELHAILDTATDGVVVLDEKGRVLSLNRSAEALFGYEQNDVAGDSITVLLSVESHRTALEYLDGLKANGFASVLNDGREVVGRERQGGAIPMFMTIGRVGSSASPKFCAVLRDMTQWKKAERELNDAKKQAERASALKSDFLAKISHEIRTPLNAILGFAEVIMEERFGPVGNDRYKDYLKDIHASGTHVMSLVNDLLDLSKIEAGKLELTFVSVDANRVVRECVSLMQPQASSARVVVRQALAPRLPNIVADERSLRQIVLNLLSNAMKFNEPGGQVIVSTALTDAGHAVIRIRDTGIGMSENEIEMALEPFRQITTAHRSSGTGLGLPLTKALVEANRASFTIKSRRQEGTLVEVAFPPTRVLAE
jgi:PAS domain S-box-containing protein